MDFSDRHPRSKQLRQLFAVETGETRCSSYLLLVNPSEFAQKYVWVRRLYDRVAPASADRYLQASAMLQICIQNALTGSEWAYGADRLIPTAVPQVKPDCPTIYCVLNFNDSVSGADRQKAKNDAKTALVKGLQQFNAELLFIASLANK